MHALEFCPKILILAGDLHLLHALGLWVLLALGNAKIPTEIGSGAVTSSRNTSFINHSSWQDLNTSQRNEQKQHLHSQFETSDAIYPRPLWTGDRG